jgi:glycosyltransferase involved in cell wall biosynthesis
MKVAVVTPTIGSKTLKQCIESVDKQTYANLTHYIFADGEQYFDTIDKEIVGASRIKTIHLEENVGKGWYGHRVYAACSYLVNADAICYLDEDNWLEPNHVETLVAKLKGGADWAYSLRKIYDKDGEYLCEDNCESLGKWPVFFSDDNFHVDTSCYMVTKKVATMASPAWYGQWGADRQFFGALKTYHPHFSCTGEYSLNYRLDGNENSVTPEFFAEGNAKNAERYPGKFPWTQKLKMEHQIAPGITIIQPE